MTWLQRCTAGETFTRTQHIVLCLGLNAITTILISVSLCWECWDETEYRFVDTNINCTETLNLLRNNGSDAYSIRLEYKDGSLSEVPDEIKPAKKPLLLWKVNASNEALSKRNASLLLNEVSGVWRLCRVPATDKEWERIQGTCGKSISKCLHYYFGDEASKYPQYCCQHTCPHAEAQIESMDDRGRTTKEAIQTIISSIIVAIILQVVSYIEAVVALVIKKVTITRLTGVTVLLSGLFVTFALIINHYKIILMNSSARSLLYLPNVLGHCRKVSIGWCMIVAWVAAVFSIFACIAWIYFSRFLVSVANKGETDKFSQPSPKEPVEKRPETNKSAKRPKSVIFRSKNRLRPTMSRAVSIGSAAALAENGFVAGENTGDVQVQEM